MNLFSFVRQCVTKVELLETITLIPANDITSYLTFFVKEGKAAVFINAEQNSTSCVHGDERARNVHTKRFSFTRICVHVNESKHLKVVLRCYLR